MKKILKTFSLLVAFATICTLGLNAAYAQDAAAKSDSTKSKFTIGVRGGLNVGMISMNNGFTSTSLAPGAQLGLFAKYDFNSFFAVALEAAWSQTGAEKFKYNLATGVGSTANGLLEINNVQINPLLHVKLPVLSVYEPYLILGPSFNLPYLATYYYNGTLGSTGVSNAIDMTEYIQPLDFGIVGGLGVDFNLRFATLTLDARYRHGLSDIGTGRAIGDGLAGSTVSSSQQTWRSRQVSFQIGLGFPIGGK